MSEVDTTLLKELIRKEKNGRMRVRLMVVEAVLRQKNKTKVAKDYSLSRTSVNQWMKRYNEGGVAALFEKPRTGRPAFITEKQREQFAQYVRDNSIKPDGGRLMGKDCIDYIQREFGVEYKQANIYKLLKSLNFSWVSSRSKHPKQDLAAQEDFKKNCS